MTPEQQNFRAGPSLLTRHNGEVVVGIRVRWIVFSALVVVVTIGCVVLGFWQLRRLDERQTNNAVLSGRLSRAPIPIDSFIAILEPQQGFTVDPADYEYTRVSIRGTLVDGEGIWVRSQVHDGQAGVHVVYPMDLGDETAVLINLGWIPLDIDGDPLDVPLPSYDQGDVIGLVRANQRRPLFGREEGSGPLSMVARIDIGRLQQQVELSLLPFWIQLETPDDPAALPIAVPPPDTSEGPHLSYAIQWFSFAGVALVGYVALMRRELRPRSRKRARESGEPGRR